MEMGKIKFSSCQELQDIYISLLNKTLKYLAQKNHIMCRCEFIPIDKIISLSDISKQKNSNPWTLKQNEDKLCNSLFTKGMMMPLTVSRKIGNTHIVLEGFHRFEALKRGKEKFNLPSFKVLCIITSKEFREGYIKEIKIPELEVYVFKDHSIKTQKVNTLFDLYKAYSETVCNFGPYFFKYENEIKTINFLNNENSFKEWIKKDEKNGNRNIGN